MPLKKTINKLYIHSADATKTVQFENIGFRSVRKLFKPMDDDFQSMVRARNKKFKDLRGIWLYETLSKYVENGRKSMKEIDPNFRASKIMKRTYDEISKKMESAKPWYEEAHRFSTWFQQIRALFNNNELVWQEKQRQLDLVFKDVYEIILSQNPDFKLEDCRSFLPGKNDNPMDIMGEWCRLWNSYLPGLFQYEQFPGSFRTNGDSERAFSKEKQMLITRAGKGIVSHMIATRGEEYLRLTHCRQKELESDIIEESTQALIYELREELSYDISNQSKRWRTMKRAYEGYDGVKNEVLTITT
jgi:hypothetical protein